MSLRIEVDMRITTDDGTPVCESTRRRIIPRLTLDQADLPDELANGLIELQNDAAEVQLNIGDQVAEVVADYRRVKG